MDMKIKTTMFALVFLGFCSAGQAAIVASTGTVVRIISYTTVGSGDVVFKLTTQHANCPGGYWLRPTDGGFKNAYASLLAARTAGLTLQVNAQDTDIWSGSGTANCRVDSIFIL